VDTLVMQTTELLAVSVVVAKERLWQ